MNVPTFNSLDDTSIYLIMPLTVVFGFILAAAWLRYARVWLPWAQAARVGKVTQPVSNTRWFISAHVLIAIVRIGIELRTTLLRFLFQSVPDGTIPTNGTYTILASPEMFFFVYGAWLAVLAWGCYTTWHMVREMESILAQNEKAA